MKIVAFDMDGTLIAESSWELLHSYFQADPFQVRKNQQEYFSHEIDYTTWMQKDIDLWDCPSGKTLEVALSSYTLEPYAKETVSSLKEEGIIPCIISSGVNILAKILGTYLGIRKDFIFANELLYHHGTLKGICHVDPFSKDTILHSLSQKMNIFSSDIAAIGDAAPDISLFRAASLTFAYNPKDTIIADAADYVIDDLRTVLSIIQSHRNK